MINKQPLRIMTYNIHSCTGTDGRVSPERIAKVIASHAPDIVNLQELDLRTKVGGMDQPYLISKFLEMFYHFHSPIHHKEGKFGNGIFTKFPLRLVAADILPGLPGRPDREPRGAIWCEVDIHGFKLQCFNTHLGLRRRERFHQIEELIGEKWIRHDHCRLPIIVCGDFNASHHSNECRILCHTLRDAQKLVNQRQHTWFSFFPIRCLDHVFVSEGIEVIRVDVPSGPLERVASDHLPVIVDFMIQRKREEP